MSRFHNTAAAERVALSWHWLGVAVSGLGLLVSAGGILWHLLAVKEHREQLRLLESDNGT